MLLTLRSVHNFVNAVRDTLPGSAAGQHRSRPPAATTPISLGSPMARGGRPLRGTRAGLGGVALEVEPAARSSGEAAAFVLHPGTGGGAVRGLELDQAVVVAGLPGLG